MQLRMKEPYRKGGANRLAARTLWRGCSPTVSAPVKKSITSAGLVSGSPIGGDAVKNSIVVSKFFAILAFLFQL